MYVFSYSVSPAATNVADPAQIIIAYNVECLPK